MTADDMLGRLFALIHGTPPLTREEFEADAAIRRTLEAVGRWQKRANVLMTWSNGVKFHIEGKDGTILESERLLIDIRDFDLGKED